MSEQRPLAKQSDDRMPEATTAETGSEATGAAAPASGTPETRVVKRIKRVKKVPAGSAQSQAMAAGESVGYSAAAAAVSSDTAAEASTASATPSRISVPQASSSSASKEPESAAPSNGSYAIECSGLTKAFGTRKAVDGVSFALPTGSFLSVFGPNGAGKTTLLRMIATLNKPSSGNLWVDGVDVRKEPDAVRARLGLISHNAMLYPDLTAEENLLLYAKLYGVQEPESRVLELLDAVGLKHRRRDLVRTFSRGMTQRVAIARALVNDPSVVLLDEPYSGLDPHAIDIFDELLESVREQRTFLMVSHDLEKGYAMADHVLVMAKGSVVSFSEKECLDPDAFRKLYKETVGMGVA